MTVKVRSSVSSTEGVQGCDHSCDQAQDDHQINMFFHSFPILSIGLWMA